MATIKVEHVGDTVNLNYNGEDVMSLYVNVTECFVQWFHPNFVGSIDDLEMLIDGAKAAITKGRNAHNREAISILTHSD